jgi:hypothetical protein
MRLVHAATTTQEPEIVRREAIEIRTHATFLAAGAFVDPDRDEEDDDDDLDHEAVTSAASVLEQLGQRLRRDKLEVDEVIQEDVGAHIEVESAGGEVFRIGAYHRGGDEWHLFVGAPEGANGVASKDELCTLLVLVDAALRRVPGIRRIAWHTNEHWEAGYEVAGKSRPVTEPAAPPRTGKFRRA